MRVSQTVEFLKAFKKLLSYTFNYRKKYELKS